VHFTFLPVLSFHAGGCFLRETRQEEFAVFFPQLVVPTSASTDENFYGFYMPQFSKGNPLFKHD